MKKETIIAIILGIGAGIGIAFFLVRQSGTTPRNNDVILDEITPTISLESSDIEPLLIQSPDPDTVTEDDTIDISATAPEGSLVVIQTVLEEIVLENTSKSFTETLDLIPGENVIKITAYNEKNIDTRTLVVYSISSSLGSADSTSDASEEDNTEGEEDENENTIEALKDKIEKKVDELSKTSKNIAVGTVTSIDDDLITVESETADTFTVSVDSTITEVFAVDLNDREEIDFEDIEEGDYLIVSGPAIEDQISANTIYVQTRYIVTQGQIANANESNFTIDVVTRDKSEYTVDIEDDTNQTILDIDTLDVSSSGFSKLKAGDSIHVVILQSSTNEDEYTGISTFIIPQEYFTADSDNGTTDEAEDE